MFRKAAVLASTVGILTGTAAAAPRDSPPSLSGAPYLLVEGKHVPLYGAILTSTTCGQLNPNEPRGGGCVIADGGARGRVPVEDRVRVPFRGSISVVVPAGTDAVSVSFGRQPAQSFDPRQPIVWPVPGSGTYYLFLEVESRRELTRTRTTYALPLYAPRS